MNKVILIGRLTKDPELKYTQSNIAYIQASVAVDRKYKSADGQTQADFINVVAWRQTAEFIAKYFRKGNRIALTGSIQTRTWDDNDGKRNYVTEVVIDDAEFCESKRQDGGAVPPPPPPTQERYGSAPAANTGYPQNNNYRANNTGNGYQNPPSNGQPVAEAPYQPMEESVRLESYSQAQAPAPAMGPGEYYALDSDEGVPF